jgi:uncharacterized protein (DUF4213/DUF364 family)
MGKIEVGVSFVTKGEESTRSVTCGSPSETEAYALVPSTDVVMSSGAIMVGGVVSTIVTICKAVAEF